MNSAHTDTDRAETPSPTLVWAPFSPGWVSTVSLMAVGATEVGGGSSSGSSSGFPTRRSRTWVAESMMVISASVMVKPANVPSTSTASSSPNTVSSLASKVKVPAVADLRVPPPMVTLKDPPVTT